MEGDDALVGFLVALLPPDAELEVVDAEGFVEALAAATTPGGPCPDEPAAEVAITSDAW
jgi:hypothetical protein